MKQIKLVLFSFIFFALVFSCNREDIDKQKPEIDLSIQGTFPQNCDTLYFGETFIFRVLFADNIELGSYTINIHHNFDHHNHSTEVTQCVFDPKKPAVNPLVFIQDYPIPDGLREFETNLEVFIPHNNNGSFDTGDYHLFINLTDKSGWSSQKGLSIKIL
jgi:hypothetical protein